MTINPYPVDSATRTCCGGIGTHTRDCRLDDVPLPPGSDTLSGWEHDDDGTYRFCWGAGLRPAETAVAVAWHASQGPDGVVTPKSAGVLIDQIGDDGMVRDCLSLTVEGARNLATALTAAADEIDGWVTR